MAVLQWLWCPSPISYTSPAGLCVLSVHLQQRVGSWTLVLAGNIRFLSQSDTCSMRGRLWQTAFTAQMSFICFLWMKIFATEETLTLFPNDFCRWHYFPHQLFFYATVAHLPICFRIVFPLNLPNSLSDRPLNPLACASPVLYSGHNQHFVFLLTSHSLILNILRSQI